MKTSDFDYQLPPELIAQTPVTPRDSSRLLVYDRQLDKVYHKHFYDIKQFLKKGDVLVRNNTRVLPARMFGYTPNGGKVEVLLLKRFNLNEWEVLVKPGKKAKPGAKLVFNQELSLEVIETIEQSGSRRVKFFYDGVFEDVISRIGEMPLPPYITEKLNDKERYQTVYAKVDGSAAAPTAGLHFTDNLIEEIKAMGVEIVDVLLHVGLGTFRPVKSEDILEHHMHSEYYEVDQHACDVINKAKKEGRRIIAVGTTSVRTLESVADQDGFLTATKGNTEIFIYPPYKFKCVDALITNFHLPKSTLLMLVSSLSTREKILELYNLAVQEKYRFFSFGDACMIL
ncbi:MAG: tRNA preQ1(34) S-adenosylmethionine ribosyltransferase-isomerase QueA [Clostridiales bacterium]|nr:tRNA preQ1(34) S-adenosylmethionine ribosyltransferase-isomerase QueA [Clostridiales bacterium]